MLNIDEADALMNKFIELRSRMNETKLDKDIFEFKRHERLCIDKFRYLVTMRTDSYRGFYNHEDLVQEGLEALVKAMKNYDPAKGNVFWWFHKYVSTRIARSANLHTTIRFPLKFAKANTPRKEPNLPIMIEKRFCPDNNLEGAEILSVVKGAIKNLDKEQQDIITYAFGFDGDKPLSINKICKKMNISRINCIRVMDSAIDVLKQNIVL